MFFFFFFFFKQKTAYEIMPSLVGSEMCIRDSSRSVFPTSMTGRAVTAVNLFGIGGSAVIQWGMGMVIGSFGCDSAGHYPPTAYAVALGITAVGGALSLLWYRSLAHRSG